MNPTRYAVKLWSESKGWTGINGFDAIASSNDLSWCQLQKDKYLILHPQSHVVIFDYDNCCTV